MSTQPWWMGSLINGWGTTQDREGPYLKPDINIVDPAGTQFTAIAPGTVTGIDTKSSYGDVVTVAFDNPLNSVATHYEFEHLTSIASDLFVGDHVSTGQVLGTGGGGQSKSGAAVGFGLTDQSVYGTGSSNEPFNMNYINPLLNPTAILNQLQSGGTGAITQMQQSGSGGTSTDCCGSDFWCHVWVNMVGPAACPNVTGAVGQGVSNGVTSGLTQAGLIVFGAAVVLIALILIFNRKS